LQAANLARSTSPVSTSQTLTSFPGCSS